MNNFKEKYEGSMDSKYYFTASKIGATASPQTPNQLGETTSRLNQGLKAVELGALNQRLLDQMPKQHFTEINRLNKLTGAEASLHAPIQDLDLAGFTQQGQSEQERKVSIEKLKSVLDRAYELDKEGNTPVTIHGGSFGIQKWQKTGLKEEVEGEIKPIKDARSEMAIVNQDSGQVQLSKYKEREYIGGKKIPWTPERYMENLNRTTWDREKLELMRFQKELNEVEDRTERYLQSINYPDLRYAADQEEKTGKKILTPQERNQLQTADQSKRDLQRFSIETSNNMRTLIEEMHDRLKAYPPTDKERLENYNIFMNEEYPKLQEEFEETQKEIKEKGKEAEKKREEYEKEKTKEGKKEKYDEYVDAQNKFIDKLNQQTQVIMRRMERAPPPQTWTSVEDFSQHKVADSVSEAAIESFKKHGNNTPLILIENVYPEMALSRADKLRDTIKEARDKFEQKLIEEKNFSKKKAEDTAAKLIGVTWDVGHIYQLKKYGYSDEDIQEEAKKIAPFVKHVHLSDNFGFEDAHLPPGLGTSNIKEQLKEFEEKGFKGRGIVEAGEFVANFKEVPHLHALSNLNAPLYVEKTEPYWHQVWDTYGNYFAGFGEMMPQKYFDLYGAPGFSQLPRTLGGTAATPEKGRLATTPTEEETS